MQSCQADLNGNHEGFPVPGRWVDGRYQRDSALFAPTGAVCVNHPSVADNLTLEDLAARCPRLKDVLGQRCDEAAAEAGGAIMFNRPR